MADHSQTTISLIRSIHLSGLAIRPRGPDNGGSTVHARLDLTSTVCEDRSHGRGGGEGGGGGQLYEATLSL